MTFLIIFIIGCAFWVYWYKRKENQELKAVEFKIISLENNLEFNEDCSVYFDKLKRQNLLPGDAPEIVNITTTKHHAFSTHVFDASYFRSVWLLELVNLNFPLTQRLIGVSVEFDSDILPRFDISKSELLDGVAFFDGVKKIDNKLLPDWLKKDFSLFHQRRSSPEVVIELFKNQSKLEPYLRHRDFHILSGNNNMFVLYFVGQTTSTVDFFNRMDAIAVDLANYFLAFTGNQSQRDKDIEVNEIKLLKKNEQS